MFTFEIIEDKENNCAGSPIPPRSEESYEPMVKDSLHSNNTLNPADTVIKRADSAKTMYITVPVTAQSASASASAPAAATSIPVPGSASSPATQSASTSGSASAASPATQSASAAAASATAPASNSNLQTKLKILQKLSSLKIIRGPIRNEFIENARKYANIEIEEAQYIPFNNYWPTYEDMSTKQKRWYFYWRKCVRTGEYPSTDISYIYLYVYELINGIGFSGCIDGFVKLCSVWSRYRTVHNNLDRNLSSWTYDFIHVYGAGMDISEIMAHIPDQSLLVHFPDYLLGEYMKNPISEMPIELISRFSDYKFHTGRFCTGEHGGLLLKLAPGCIKQLNIFFNRTTGKSIFEQYEPLNKSTRSRLPFQNALYNGDVKEIKVTHSYYAFSTPLREYITSVIKHLENCLRKITGVKGKLRGYNLDSGSTSIIEKYAEEALNNIRLENDMASVEIDRDRIIRLINDSNEILNRLLEGSDNDDNKDNYYDDGNDKNNDNDCDNDNSNGNYYNNYNSNDNDNDNDNGDGDGDGDDSDSGNNRRESDFKTTHTKIEPESPCSSYDMAVTDSNEFVIFTNLLTNTGIDIIRFIIENGFTVSEQALTRTFTTAFVRAEIDKINSSALDSIGDLVLEEDNAGHSWSIFEDYRDELEGVFLLD